MTTGTRFAASRPRALCLALCLALLAGPACLAPAAARAATPDQVDAAVKRGADWLVGQQKDDVLWEQVPYDKRIPQKDPAGKEIGPLDPPNTGGGQWGGRSALATYALLSTGRSATDPKLARAIDLLRRANLTGVYAVGVRAQIWLYLPKTEENRQAMARDARFLMEAMQGNDASLRGKPSRNNVGLFDYLLAENDRVDLSVSQYGVLGLWAAVRYGWELPAGYWQAAETAWYNWQQPDGGWAYGGAPHVSGDPKNPIYYPTTLSITSAGVASLYITLDALHANDGVRCNGNVSSPRIDAGLAFLADGLPYLLDKKPYPDDPVKRVAIEGNNGGSRYYTLYGVERIGVASGLKFFGDLDWYADGAEWLRKKQNGNGSWGGGEGDLRDTAFALLFLSRGREPVMMNKLIYDEYAGPARPARPGQPAPERKTKPGDWNQRPRDVANLARFVNSAGERSLNWQSIKLQAGRDGLVELADAPILYLAGDGEPAFTDAEKQVLRDYVYNGGLILGNADCGKNGFESGFQQLGQALFPDYEFRVLEDDSPIYTDGQFPMKDKRRKPSLLALGNGAREFMVLVKNEDFARDWQLGNLQNEEAFQVGANLYLYATDLLRQPDKGRSSLVFADNSKPTRTIEVARVRYNGTWDPEPGGWPRLAAVMHNRDATDLKVRTVDLADGDFGSAKIAHLTGTGEVQLPAAQAAKLKAFVAGGGTLVIDAAGGDSGFLRSMEAMLRSEFPDKADALAGVLPASSPVYAGGKEPIKRVTYRVAALKTLGAETAPRLRAIPGPGGRPGVILSNEDLSVGLNGSPVGGILGYVPEDATKLMESILLYAAK